MLRLTADGTRDSLRAMCGRYTFTSPEEAARRLFGYASPPLNLRPNYNVAPTHDVPIVRNAAAGGRELVQVRWGLIPFWAKDAKIGYKCINARVETVVPTANSSADVLMVEASEEWPPGDASLVVDWTGNWTIFGQR